MGRRPIGPGTEATYRMVLERAFGEPPYKKTVGELDDWALSSLKILHAATLKYAPHRVADLPDEEWSPTRVIKAPTEGELAAFEAAAEKQLAPPARAMVLLPLAIGLRASEVLNLERVNVKRALEGEELLVMRKGGEEQLLPAGGIGVLLEDLISAGDWKMSWQILSPTSERAAYRKLHRLIQGLAPRAQMLRPHKLRHGFATRMQRDGADLSQIQLMLNHGDPKTTARYVHPENREIVKFLRKVNRRPLED